MDEPDITEIIGTQKPAANLTVIKKALDNLQGQSDAPAPALNQSDLPEAFTSNGDSAIWVSNNGNFWLASGAHTKLPAGIYRTGSSSTVGCYLAKHPVVTDNLLGLPDPVTPMIIAQFNRFWESKQTFTKYGFLHKRGFLLYGPPGSGKTSLVQFLSQKLVNEMDGIVIFIDHPKEAAECFALVRKLEPYRPIIGIMEDLDNLIQQYGESTYLALLDGECQIDNVIFLATTNYPEVLDRRFVDRPSRFDLVQYVGMPNKEARKMYLQLKDPELTGKDLDYWADKSEGLSVAHLKELIIAVRCFNQDPDEVITRLKKWQSIKPSSEKSSDKHGVGFSKGN
jgi:adenylate kinase family enzyme